MLLKLQTQLQRINKLHASTAPHFHALGKMEL